MLHPLNPLLHSAYKRLPTTGVAGGTASGKTTVCDRIYQRLHDDSAVTMLSQDAFYKELNEQEKEQAARNGECRNARGALAACRAAQAHAPGTHAAPSSLRASCRVQLRPPQRL